MNEWRVKSSAHDNLEWLGVEGALLTEHDYIFFTKKGEDVFIEIQKSMHELNDFCVTLFTSIVATGASEEARRNDLWESALAAAPEEGYDTLFSLGELAYKGNDLGRIFSPASATLLLYATLIRSLHSIASHYGEEKYKHWQSQNPRGAELPALIELLESICNKKLHVFQHLQVKALIIDRARKLRNNFIHGDWLAVERDLVGVSIRRCFEVVSYIFSELELVFDEDQTPSGKVIFFSFHPSPDGEDPA